MMMMLKVDNTHDDYKRFQIHISDDNLYYFKSIKISR